jgi:malonate-semialdehyde dehydrogenase (acetylating)/methylmalonate-semialdehyde dehydrogenase
MEILREVRSHYGKLKLYINGSWVDSSSELLHSDTNPATGEEIAQVPVATKEEAREAVEAAQRGFEQWRDVGLRERGKILFDIRQRLEERFEELSRVLTQDHGRTIAESRGSVRRVIENIESACSALYGLPKRNEYVDQLTSGIDEWLVWEPLGPFLIVTPGNIPMHAWSSFVPYALAAGCSVVVSPSRQDPVAAQWITEAALHDALPPGVINMVHGGREINSFILQQPEIKGLGFIGSNRAGKELYELCGRLGKPASINGNGKNHVVVMPDADLDQTADWLLRSCFGMTGQRCLGSDSVVVIGSIYEELKERFVRAASSMKMGYGLDESVQLGPYTTEDGRQKVEAWIEQALKDGCRMVLDGRHNRPRDYPNGYFMGPTILEDGHPEMPSAKVEAFGAVACLMRCASLDEAIEWINTKTNLGHSACIMTRSGRAARKFTREVNVGNVGINVAIPQPYAFFPLGSRRESFLGRAKSRMGSMALFMDEKTVTARWI